MKFPRPLWQDLAIIFGITTLISLPLWLAGGDAALAHLVYQPDSKCAWFWRQYAQIPMLIFSFAALGFLLMPQLRKKHPTLRLLAVIWLLSLLIGGGLLNQVLIQDLIDRARPRESVLAALTGVEATLGGHSFPSGHAVIGFMLAIPFFVYRTIRPKLAIGFLIAGILGGLGIGFARMTLGAHFLTDVLWAGAILFGSAAVFVRIPALRKDIPTWFTAGFIAFALFNMVWWNAFTLKLTHTVQNPAGAQVYLPCASFNYPAAPAGTQVTLHIKGFGAPLSNLTLIETPAKAGEMGEVSLQRWRGMYRSLDCVVIVETK